MALSTLLSGVFQLCHGQPMLLILDRGEDNFGKRYVSYLTWVEGEEAGDGTYSLSYGTEYRKRGSGDVRESYALTAVPEADGRYRLEVQLLSSSFYERGKEAGHAEPNGEWLPVGYSDNEGEAAKVWNYWLAHRQEHKDTKTEKPLPEGIASPASLPWYSLTTYETSRPVRLVHHADMDSLVANLSHGDNLLFTDLYPIVEELPPAGDEPFILKERLHVFGFDQVENSEGRGNWERGPRFITGEVQRGNLRCVVKKAYQIYERMPDGNHNMIVYEQIECREVEE